MLNSKVNFYSKWYKNNLLELPKVKIWHSSYHFYFSKDSFMIMTMSTELLETFRVAKKLKAAHERLTDVD